LYVIDVLLIYELVAWKEKEGKNIM